MDILMNFRTFCNKLRFFYTPYLSLTYNFVYFSFGIKKLSVQKHNISVWIKNVEVSYYLLILSTSTFNFGTTDRLSALQQTFGATSTLLHYYLANYWLYAASGVAKVLWGKKYSCSPRQQKLEFEVKNRCKSAEKAKAEHLLQQFLSFLRVIKRILR